MDLSHIERVEVLTVAKVGSSDFLYSLRHKWPTHHGHSTKRLQEVLDTGSNTLIVAGARNPLDRNLSYFFQTYSDDFYNDVRTAANAWRGEHCYVAAGEQLLRQSPSALIAQFLSQRNHWTFNEWWADFFAALPLRDFDKQRGYQFYPLARGNVLLLYTLEKLSANNAALAAALGVQRILHCNNAQERAYAQAYQQAKDALVLSAEYKSTLLDTDVMRFFYTDADIEAFRRRFSKKGP